MKSNKKFKFTRDNICLIAYGAVFAICALAFWLFCPPDGANVYTMVVLWLVMPLASVLFSYMLTVSERPRGWKRFIPFICAAILMLLEYVTIALKNMIAFPGNVNPPSIFLAIFGMVASLIGFSFAKQDRKENAKATKQKKVIVEEEVKLPEPEIDYAESDANFSIDSPEEIENNETEEAKSEVAEDSEITAAAEEALTDNEEAPVEDNEGIEESEPEESEPEESEPEESESVDEAELVGDRESDGEDVAKESEVDESAVKIAHDEDDDENKNI